MTKARRATYASLFSTTILIVAQACSAQAPAIEDPAVVEDLSYIAAIEQSRALIQQRLDEGLPGFSVAVSVDGQTVWAEGMGLRDVELQAPVTLDTRFRIGSTSKSITSALAGRLVEAGLIDLEADIRDTYPEFPQKRWSISLLDLLSNQAGIRHYRGQESRNITHYASVAEGLEIFAADTLLFEPHSSAFYSSYGFNLAGAVMARAAGNSYGDAIRREIFHPLGMTASGIDDPTVSIEERATFYSSDQSGEIQLATPVDDSYKAPSGGLLSTPSDLVRFGAALLSGVTASGDHWLEAPTVERMFTPRPIADGRSAGYALGFRAQAADPTSDPPVPHAVHHGGSSVGGRSMLYMLPDQGIVVSILCNSDAYDDKEDDAEAIGGFFADHLPG